MNEEKEKEIKGIYEELKGVAYAIKEDVSWFDDNGFTDHANQIIRRIPEFCVEIQDIRPYLIDKKYNNGRNTYIVNTTPTRAKLNSIIGRLKGLYNLDISALNNGNTIIQNQSQNQSQSLTILLDLQEKIINEIAKHKKGSNERNFLEKFKSSLSSIKNIIDILAITLKTGAEYGLDPSTIRKLLNL